MKYDVDLEKYYSRYKEIFTTLTLNGDILPYALYMINIPNDYDFTLNERVKLFSKLGENEKSKIEELYWQRREKEIEIFHSVQGKKKINTALEKLYNKEMKIFLDKYSIFKDVIKEN